MPKPDTIEPVPQRATSEPKEIAPEPVKQENAKLTPGLGSGLRPAGNQVLIKQGSEVAEMPYSPADLRGLLEKVTLKSEQDESSYFSQKETKSQHGHFGTVSVLATSKLANQAAPK